MHRWTSDFPHETEKKKVFFFSLKEFIAQFQTVWCNLQLGVPLCIAGGDKGMPRVAGMWSSSLLWCERRTRSCAEAHTRDSRVIDCFGPDTSADGSHCFYSLLVRLLSPPFALLLDSPARISHCFFQDDWLWWAINRVIACENMCVTPDHVEPQLANVLAMQPRAPVHLQLFKPERASAVNHGKKVGPTVKSSHGWSGFNPGLYEWQQALHTATAGAHLKLHSRVSVPLWSRVKGLW